MIISKITTTGTRYLVHGFSHGENILAETPERPDKDTQKTKREDVAEYSHHRAVLPLKTMPAIAPKIIQLMTLSLPSKTVTSKVLKKIQPVNANK